MHSFRYLAAVAAGVAEVQTASARPLPSGWARVKVAYAGVCHSDTAGLRAAGGPFPYRMGHEVSGTVIETTDPSIPKGTRVVAAVEDGYATEVVAPVTALVPLAPSCDLLDASLAEPLACVIGAVEMLDLSRVDRIVVVGAGFMGLLTVAYLAAMGHKVEIVEPRAVAREKASELGAASVLQPAEVDVAAFICEMVIEATGTSGGLQTASDLVATNGTLGILGYHQSESGRRTVDMRKWNFRALRVLNLQHREQSDLLRWINRAQRMMARGVIRPSRLVDCFLGIDELPRAFGDDPPAHDLKAVLCTTAGAG